MKIKFLNVLVNLEHWTVSQMMIVLLDASTVYNVDTAHGFAEIQKHVDKLKNLAGPVYDIESGHHFNGLTERMETLKNLKGPVYDIENQHHFNEFEKQVH